MKLKTIDFTDQQVSTFYMLIGRNVKKIRKEKGVSQLELALAIGHTGVGTVSVAEVCYNDKHFNLEHLYKIANVLNVDIKDFFEGIETAKPD